VSRQTPDFPSGIRGERYRFYAMLRERWPVYYDERMRAYIVSRYDDVMRVLRDHETYSSAAMGELVRFPLISDDPPRHTQLRTLVNRAFTSTRLKRLEPDIARLANELIDAFAASEVEIVESLTVPLPVVVISWLLGVAEDEREQFKRWSDAITGILDEPTDEARMATAGQMYQYFMGEVERRRNAPTEDLISAVLKAEERGVRLTDEQVVAFCLLLLVAGNETTTNLLGNLLGILAQQPELWAVLREDRALVEPAIEEALRFESPVQFLFRRTTRSTELRGIEIPSGATVLASLGSANRDEAEFEEAGRFIIARERSRHIAFGYGAHFCIGAPLARIESRWAMEALLDRFDGIAPGQSAGSRVRSDLLHGYSALPLRFGT
jgi:cytochrome P450